LGVVVAVVVAATAASRGMLDAKEMRSGWFLRFESNGMPQCSVCYEVVLHLSLSLFNLPLDEKLRWGGLGVYPVCLSVCLSVCLFVWMTENRGSGSFLEAGRPSLPPPPPPAPFYLSLSLSHTHTFSLPSTPSPSQSHLLPTISSLILPCLASCWIEGLIRGHQSDGSLIPSVFLQREREEKKKKKGKQRRRRTAREGPLCIA
jgi:hypothetical protein